MQLITRVLCASTFAVTSSLVLANEGDAQARQQWHESVLAGYQSLSNETGELASLAGDYCEAPTDPDRKQLESAWLDAFLAWQRVRFVDFGPVENNNLSWQFQFWPDPKNLIARKAGYLLGHEETITPDVISQSGVAVQGFPMLEYLLFDQQLHASDSALPATRTCELLTSIAKYAARNGEELTEEWQAFKVHYLENEQYRDTTIRAGMTALELLEERRLGQPMGLFGNGSRNPYITDAWRSGNSLIAIEATAAGLQQHFLPGLATLLEANGESSLADRIRGQFDKVLENFPEARISMVTAIDDDERFGILQNLYVDVSQLTTLVNDEAAVALGVIRGFNSSDGD